MSVTEQVKPVDEPDTEQLKDLPPSAKLVAKVLEYEGTQTQDSLAAETLLPPRTVRYALNRLEKAHIVESRISFADARKRLYALTIDSLSTQNLE